MAKILHQLIWLFILLLTRFWYIPGGAVFLPSTSFSSWCFFRSYVSFLWGLIPVWFSWHNSKRACRALPEAVSDLCLGVTPQTFSKDGCSSWGPSISFWKFRRKSPASNGGGNSKIFLSSPLKWGNHPSWRAYFATGLKPPARHEFFIEFPFICMEVNGCKTSISNQNLKYKEKESSFWTCFLNWRHGYLLFLRFNQESSFQPTCP